MERLFNGFTLKVCPQAFPLGMDSMVLADFVKLPRNASVLDLGSGCGTLGLLLCAKDPNCRVTGIEICEEAHETALLNIADNELTGRLSSICGDITQVSATVTPGSFSCVVSNPPYFSAGPQSKTLPNARQETLCTLEDLFRSAAWALRYGGDFFLVHRPERLAHICAVAAQTGLTPKKLKLIRHRPDQPVNLILLQCRKGGKHGLIWEESCLFDAENRPTEAYRKIYHLEEDEHGRNVISGSHPHR